MKRWSTFSKIWAWTKLNSIAKEGDVRESAINYHITRAPDLKKTLAGKALLGKSPNQRNKPDTNAPSA